MKVVILNDTTADLHHGCARVMRLLVEGLAHHGMTVIARSPVHHDWEGDATIRTAMSHADIIVINGEGTLHHGRPGAARLLRVTEVAGNVPVALVNALYQDNPPEWGRWLSRLAHVSTRDSRSADAIAAVTGRKPVVVPDLTLSARIDGRPRTVPITYGDSVKDEVTAALAARADRGAAPLVPSLSALKRPKGRSALMRRLRDWHIARHTVRMRAAHPTLEICATEDAYAARIAAARLHVTGRFHGVCYAIAAGTPFLAITSNSWKTEALIADAGLARWRVTDLAGLDDLIARGPDALAFTAKEQSARNAYLDHAAAGAEAMFAALASLAADR